MPGYDLIIQSEHKGPQISNEGRDAIECLASYAISTRLQDLPSDVIEHARHIFLDTLGVMLGGSVEPQAAALASRLGSRDAGDCTLVGHDLRSSKLNAALVNGTAATWLDFDSGHRPPPGKPLLPAAHPPVHLVPAALAAAEAEDASGAELIESLVVGYDVGARIGLASRLRAEIHPHGTYHNVSAASAVARLEGADAIGMINTIALAVHLEIMPSFENAFQGRTVRNVYAGVGATAGILAAQLAKANFTPQYDALGSIYGTVISPWLDTGRLVKGLGRQYEITQGFIKPFAACRFAHPAVEAAEKLIKKHPVDLEDIDAVEVMTFDWAAALDDQMPQTDLGAKFSVPWAVAAMLVRGSAGADEFRSIALRDERLRAVAARIRVKEDPRYSAATPQKRPARVTLKTRQGEVYTQEVERSGGGPDAPLSREMVLNKFRSLAEPVIGHKQSEAVIDKVGVLGDIADIRDITRLLIPPVS
jgi:2-methylcitrate dehydratase PrpD